MTSTSRTSPPYSRSHEGQDERSPDAVALASVAVHLRVTQIVNQVVGAHAVLPPGAIR